MNALRPAAAIIAAVLVFATLLGGFLSGANYAAQDRAHIDAAPSRQHWLGTDALGRDRLSRLLEGTRVSILLAPAAAGISTLLAFGMGAIPGLLGGWWERAAKTAIDLFLSIPWLFLLLMVRAMLPLNTSPRTSVTITFLVLGVLGWAGPARILLGRARSARESDVMLLARATGSGGFRLLHRQLLPNLWPVLAAQFWVSVPVFILSEANLSILGLGVAEPLPSLGSLLRGLETAMTISGNWCRFVPLLVLVVLVSSLQIATSKQEFTH